MVNTAPTLSVSGPDAAIVAVDPAKVRVARP
jgi:hypothetical protein